MSSLTKYASGLLQGCDVVMFSWDHISGNCDSLEVTEIEQCICLSKLSWDDMSGNVLPADIELLTTGNNESAGSHKSAGSRIYNRKNKPPAPGGKPPSDRNLLRACLSKETIRDSRNSSINSTRRSYARSNARESHSQSLSEALHSTIGKHHSSSAGSRPPMPSMAERPPDDVFGAAADAAANDYLSHQERVAKDKKDERKKEREKQILFHKGYLYKEGGGTSFFGRNTWKRRYFVMEHFKLVYHRSEEEYLRGAPPLKNVVIDLPNHRVLDLYDTSAEGHTISDEVCFKLVHVANSVHRDWYLKAENNEEKIKWLQVLRGACQKR